MKRGTEIVLKEISDVKIQGANNVALAGIMAYVKDPSEESYKKILAARPTEPLLQNAFKILKNSKNKKEMGKALVQYINSSKSKIALAGSKLIKNDMNIFSHCHSSTVMEILKYAKKEKKKKFIVYTLEVEPLLQGRKTAEELAKAGIKVIVFPDLAAESALRKCDLFLFGADAFTKKGVANKIGTEFLCHLAKEHNIPRYSCGMALKFTKKVKIEERSGREVWDAKNENIVVVNPAFDFTKKKLLSGVISELGILNFRDFVKKAKRSIKDF